MKKSNNHKGKRFNKLIVIKDSGKRYRGSGDILWECICDCGNITYTRGCHLKSGHTKSCGCLRDDKVKLLSTSHGMYRTPENYSWRAIKQRCHQLNYYNFFRYGGRGIYVCRRWRNSFENFFKDMGPRPKGKTLDRIDNNGPYGKWNCRWATATQQYYNK